MSFLLNASDPETVAAALAFIDAFDSPASSAGSSSDCQQHGEDAEENEAAVGRREKAKTERSRAWYSARLRARKKIELLQLQEQVAGLELQLKRLQNERCNNGDTSRSWLERAANEALNRQKAEEMNAQLKVLLRRLMKDCQALQGMFVNLRGISYSYKSASCCPSSSSLGLSLSSNEATPQLDELRGYLDRMYSDTQVFFAPSRVIGEEYNSQSRRDPSSGDISLQMSSLTPVNCDFKSAGGVFWAGMQMKHKHCWKENVQCLQPSANTVKSYRVRACNVTGQRTLHGVTYVRKFEERDRVLYVWASAIVPLQRETTNGCELRFREKGWVMLSRAPGNPDQQSVFQTRYEASSEHCGEVSPDNGHFYRNVINLLSSTQRALHEQLEDRAVN